VHVMVASFVLSVPLVADSTPYVSPSVQALVVAALLGSVHLRYPNVELYFILHLPKSTT
jgi:hypothetical protein